MSRSPDAAGSSCTANRTWWLLHSPNGNGPYLEFLSAQGRGTMLKVLPR